MKKLTIYRSLSIGMLVMMAAFFSCLITNLLCFFEWITAPVCLWMHVVLLPAVSILCVLFVCRLRRGELFALVDEEAFARDAMRLLYLGGALLLLLVLWAASFALVIFVRGRSW